MSTNLQELQYRVERDHTLVETLREVVARLTNVVKNEQTTIDELRREIDELPDASI